MISTRPLSLPDLTSSTTRTAARRAAQLRYVSGTTVRRDGVDRRASNKLLEDAAREEAEATRTPARPSRAQLLEDQNQNWTGDESVQDAVLRMLVDKYKPLRSGPVRSADEKLKAAPPKVSTPELGHEADPLGEGPYPLDGSLASDRAVLSTPRKYVPGEPILPGIEGHQPWHTTFKVPSHATSNVHYGHIPRQSSKRAEPPPVDDKERRKQKEIRRRAEHAGRLSRARESTLDYRLGIRGGPSGHRHNPSSLKGWANLVEDRIQVRRVQWQAFFLLMGYIASPRSRLLQQRSGQRPTPGFDYSGQKSIHRPGRVPDEPHRPASGRGSALGRDTRRCVCTKARSSFRSIVD